MGDGDVYKEARLWCGECGRTTTHSTDVGSKSWDAGYYECGECGNGRLP